MMGHHMITPDVKPAVSMADAVAAAEKAGDAQARGAMLRQGPNGLVWNVMLQKKDGKPLMSVWTPRRARSFRPVIWARKAAR